MPDDDRADGPPAGPQLVRWLRALADAVERDPALAARLVAEIGNAASPPDPLSVLGPLPQNGEGGQTDAAPTKPAVRHAKRASKYGAPTVAGRAPELGKGVPDPFAIAATSGEDALRKALDTLRAGTLRAIIRAHDLDPAGKLASTATEASMRKLILAAVGKAEGQSKAAGDKKKQ